MARRNNQLNQREMKVIQSEVIPDSFNFDELFMLFLQDGNLRNLRPHTLTYYFNELMSFRKALETLELDTTPAKIKPNHINQFIIYSKDVLELKIVSINTRVLVGILLAGFRYFTTLKMTDLISIEEKRILSQILRT